jgi:hypothetical protein
MVGSMDEVWNRKRVAATATVVLLLAAVLTSTPALAEVEIFRAESREAVLEGTLDAVSVDPLGGLELAPRVERLAGVDEPFVFTAAGHPDGWVVGTGSSGKVLLVGADGAVRELFAAEEPQIFALHVDPDGTVFAGSSPDGKVYRIRDGEAAEVFDPEESYVWAITRDARGRLLVATGLGGRLYAVGDRGEASVLIDSRDVHIRSLALLPDGAVLAGTAGQGLILRLDPDGTVTTVHDAAHPEIAALTVAPDGTAYAALLASEASQVDLSQRASSSGSSTTSSGSSDGDGDDEEGGTTVVVVSSGNGTTGSRGAGFSGPRSTLLELPPGGPPTELFELQNETIHSLLADESGVWIGTGEEGRLYRYEDDALIQARTFDEKQLAAIASGGQGAAVVTANASAVHRLGGGVETRGKYTSKVLDAKQVARFGSFLWEGSLPKGAAVELAFRSGMSSKPDATWTDWGCDGCGDPKECTEGGAACRRRSVSLAGLAHGRYAQWRATLRAAERGDHRSPRIEAVELSYRQENLRPKVTELEVLDPGQILVPQSFNPTTTTFEPWSPNREGIFTTLRDESSKDDSRLKTLWKKGYRTLRWKAADDNDDELRYRLDFKADGGGEAGEDGWMPVVKELEDEYYSFDATVLPDGLYRFRLTASDRPAHVEAEALADDELSEPVVIDHTPPELVSVKRRGSTVEVTLRDRLSPLREAAVSVDAGEWRPVAAADGLLDGREEVLRLEVPPDARLLLLRLTDAAWNVVTFDLLSEQSR